MATSIDKSTNWRNAVKDVGYEGAANPNVVVAEQANTNNKAMKVAEALGQVGNSLGQLANTHNSITQQQQAQVQRKATALEIDQATLAGVNEAAYWNEARKQVDVTEHSTYEEVHASIYEKDELAAARVAEIQQKYADNPEALSAYNYQLGLKTQASFVKMKGEVVYDQAKNTIAGLVGTSYEQGLEKHGGNQYLAYRHVQENAFKTLNEKYGYNKKVSAQALGEILLTRTTTRDAEGNANTYLAEQYIKQNFGSDDMRKALSKSIGIQNKAAAQDKNNQRILDGIKEQEELDAATVEILSGEYLNKEGEPVTRSDILSDVSLTDTKKLALTKVVDQVEARNKIQNEPALIAEARLLVINVKDKLKYAAASGDYTALGFPEGVVPSKVDLQRKLTEDYAHQVPNAIEFNKIINTAAVSLETSDLINRKDSMAEFTRQLGLIEDGYGKDLFDLKANAYGNTFYNGKVLRKELNDRYHDIIIKKIRAKAIEAKKNGEVIDDQDFDDIYDEAAEQTFKHLLDYMNADIKQRETMTSQGVPEITPPQSSPTTTTDPNLKTVNQAGLQAWEAASQKNGGYPNEAFLQAWDTQKLARPSTAPEGGVNKSNDTSVAPTMEPEVTTPEVVTEQPTTETIEWTPEQTSRLIEKVPAKQVKTVSKLLKSKVGTNPSKDELVDVAIEGIASNLTGVNQLGGTKADDILAGLSSLGVDVTSEDILSRVREAVAEREQKQYLADYIIGGLANAPEQLVMNAYDFAETAVKQFGHHTGLSTIGDLFTEERLNRKIQEAEDRRATFNPKTK